MDPFDEQVRKWRVQRQNYRMLGVQGRGGDAQPSTNPLEILLVDKGRKGQEFGASFQILAGP